VDSVVKIDDRAPDFERESLEGGRFRLSEQRGRVVILNFWSAECDWSERSDEILASAKERWGERVVIWWIIANPNESHARILELAAQREIDVMLMDETQSLVEQYGAITTPHFFVIDEFGRLRYRGALDDTSFRQKNSTKSYLLDAIDALLGGRAPDPQETPAYGCAITRQDPSFP
jgi:peroxiredoxin